MLNFYSPWMFFLSVGLLLLFTSTSLFRAADGASGVHPHRMHALDGLRGFLALAVFFYHAEIFHAWTRDGSWTVTPSHFYNAIGPGGLALFFMITGFLFWSQLLRAGGRPVWLSLFTARVFRIAPLYYVMLIGLFTYVVLASSGRLHEPAFRLCRQVIGWLSCGFFGILGLNSTRDLVPLAGAVWSLQYEWWFYLSLPLLAFGAMLRRMHLAFVLALLLAAQLYIILLPSARHAGVVSTCCLFLYGMLVASLLHVGFRVRLPQWLRSALALVLLAASLAQYPSPQLWWQLLLGCFLFLVVEGCDLFGLLTLQASLRLGNASYGIYLLQGFASFALFHSSAERALDQVSPAMHWLLTDAAALLLVCLATATHALVELPGIRLGKRVAARLQQRFPGRNALDGSRDKLAHG